MQKLLQLIQNNTFRPKPEGAISAEEESCQFCHNMTEIVFFPLPEIAFFIPTQLKVHSVLLSEAAFHIFPVPQAMLNRPRGPATLISYSFLCTWADVQAFLGEHRQKYYSSLNPDIIASLHRIFHSSCSFFAFLSYSPSLQRSSSGVN